MSPLRIMSRWECLEATGQALHGPRWRGPISRDARFNLRSIFWWQSGEKAVPARIAQECIKLLRTRAEELLELSEIIAAQEAEVAWSPRDIHSP